MNGFAVQPVDALLIIPALSALVLAFPSGYRLTSRINLISSRRRLPFRGGAAVQSTGREQLSLCR